jgi:uncharacterized protein YyaL (SSP411 family)
MTFYVSNMPQAVEAGKESLMEPRKANRLIDEKSPYLLQHAHNPVDWFPWCPEAFEKAKKRNKPIFLSVGYSTCHWCHVMEKESFEDLEVAALMNELFVSIKVDREERPDIDHVYMTVCQMLTGSGGWPLTIIMTPDEKPFYAATYIPKDSRFGRLGMTQLIPRIRELWVNRQSEILTSAAKILDVLEKTGRDEPGETLGREVLDKAFDEMTNRFDSRFGGFSDAPKFPTAHNHLFLLRYWRRTGNRKALDMVEKTLQAMRMGGIYDHLGYGFHRYATDREWLVPHFEKMLYDQAMLALAYLEAHQATGNQVYGETASEVFEYVLRDLTAPAGGFYSAEDADSEGVEGKFYVWTPAEVQAILGATDAELFCNVFRLETEGNFNEEATGRATGANILHLKKTMAELAKDLHLNEDELRSQLELIRQKLFKLRENRIHPHKDDKILTDWNGLMIAALARGSQVLGNDRYARAAERAADFLLGEMRRADGRLLHRFRDGEAKIEAHLDDYAFMVWGLLEIYEANFDTRFLKSALELNRDMISHFWDEDLGGAFFTPDDGERLIVRKKEVYDGAIPSGNSVVMHNFLKLARFTGNTDLEGKAERIEKAFSGQVRNFPSGYTHFLVSVDFGLGPSYEVVVVGNEDAPDTRQMLQALRQVYIPNKIIMFRPSNDTSPEVDEFSPFVQNHHSIEGKATAYVCLNNACKSPTTDITQMLNLMR